MTVEFIWAVDKEGYKWVDANGKPMCRGRTGEGSQKLSGLFLSRPDSGPMYKKKLYAPLRLYTGLFRTFAATELTPTGILTFANKYGLLGEEDFLYTIRPTGGGGSSVGIPLETWIREISVMRRALNLCYSANRLDEDAVADGCLALLHERTRVEKFSQFKPNIRVARHSAALFGEVDTEDLFAGAGVIELPDENERGHAPTGGPLQPTISSGERREPDLIWDAGAKANDFIYGDLRGQDPTYQLGMSNLLRLANAKLHGSVAPQLFWERDRSRLAVYLAPEDLLSAMWMQLALALDAEKNYRQCPQCSSWFEVSPSTARKDKVFCSNACRMKSYRQRRSMPAAKREGQRSDQQEQN